MTRDAELLADAVVADDLDRYQRIRDNLSMPLFDHIEELASLEWDAAEARRILMDCASAMSAESHALGEYRNAARTPAC